MDHVGSSSFHTPWCVQWEMLMLFLYQMCRLNVMGESWDIRALHSTQNIIRQHMMTSSNGNIFRDTGHLCGEFTDHQWIPAHKGQWRGILIFSLICAWINGWVNNGEAGDLRRHMAHYDTTVMNSVYRWYPAKRALPALLTCTHDR